MVEGQCYLLKVHHSDDFLGPKADNECRGVFSDQSFRPKKCSLSYFSLISSFFCPFFLTVLLKPTKKDRLSFLRKAKSIGNNIPFHEMELRWICCSYMKERILKETFFFSIARPANKKFFFHLHSFDRSFLFCQKVLFVK
jgi:hypothetical protein